MKLEIKSGIKSKAGIIIIESKSHCRSDMSPQWGTMHNSKKKEKV